MHLPWHRSCSARTRRLSSSTPRLEVLEERRLLSATQDDPIAEPLVLTGGAEFQVNTTTFGDQLYPRVTPFADGGFAVTWTHNNHPAFQRYDAAGNPVGAETQLPLAGSYASVAADGTSVVAYAFSWNLRAQRYDASGNALGSTFIVNTLPLSGNSGVQAFTDEVGNYTFVWHSSTSSRDMIYYRRFDSNGAPLTDQMPVGEVAEDYRIYTDMNSAGDLVIVYDSAYALIKGSGEVVHAPLPNPTASQGVDPESVDITAAGNFAVRYWIGASNYVQRFDVTGLPDGDPVDVTFSPVGGGSLRLEPGGDFVLIAHRSFQGYEPGGSGAAVVAQRFDASGTAEAAFLVNTFVAGDQRYPSAAMLDSSTFVVAWQSANQDGSGLGVFAKRFTDDDVPTVELVAPEEGPSISEGETLLSQIVALRVTFSRPMNEASVESPANWQLLEGGFDVSSLIVGITYENDVAYVALAEPLRGSGYELIVHDSIQDSLGRALDGNENGTAGDDYSISFSVKQGVFGVGPEQIVHGEVRSVYYQNGVAINDDNSYAVVFLTSDNFTEPPISEARVFDPSGQAIFPAVAIDGNTGSLLPLQDGEFLVAVPGGIRTFDAAGAEPVVPVNPGGFGVFGPSTIARAPDGTFIVAGSVQITQSSPAAYDVRYQRFAADGTALGPAASVYQPSNDLQQDGPEVFVFDNGEFVIAWSAMQLSGPGHTVYARRFAADGTPSGDRIEVDSTDTYGGWIDVAGDRSGSFTVVWSEIDFGISEDRYLFARRYDAFDQPLSEDVHLRTVADGQWTRPRIAMDDSGRSIITWQEGTNIFVQGFSANGQPLTDPFSINEQPVTEDVGDPLVAMNSTGEAVVSWNTDYFTNIRARRLSLGAFPVLDLNGAADGIDFAADKDPGELLLPIVDADELTITSSSPTLVGATIQMDPSLVGGELGVDTTGTNITATYSASGITLSGVDTVANYQQVLRTLVFAPPYSFEGGETTEIEFTIDDGSATSPIATARVRNTAPAEVLGRHLYYAGAKYDDPLPGPHYHNAAYDTSKTAYQAGSGAATFANVSSYTRGINGIVLYTNGDYGLPSASDFTFKMGTSTDPGNWVDAPAPSAITFREGAGPGGTDIVELTWPEGAIKNTWLEVTMLAGENTGLAANDVFYFGSRVGDTGLGNSAAAAITSAADQLAARGNLAINVGIENPYDFDRNGIVSAGDELASRFNPGILLMLNLPAAGAPASAAPLVAAPKSNGLQAIAAALASPAAVAGGIAANFVELPAADAVVGQPALNAVALAVAIEDEPEPLAGIAAAEPDEDHSLLDELLPL